MADDKKAAAPAPHKWHPIEIIVILLLLASVVGAIISNVGNYLATNQLSFFGVPLGSVRDFFFGENNWLFKLFSIAVSIGSMAGVVALSHMKGEILLAEKAKLFPMGEPELGKVFSEEENELKERWRKIVEQAESTIESNWRVAIIEADIILDDLLFKLNLPGDTIGQKLQAVEKSDFTTLDLAWEAHKARNQIAHGGSDFLLNQRETRRIIGLYERVFKEFYLI